MVKRKSPNNETQQNKKLKSFHDKEKTLEGLLQTFTNGVEQTKRQLKKLRDEKRKSLRPAPISIPTVGTPTFITAPQQLIEAPDGSVMSKKVFPDGTEVITVSTMYSDSTMYGGVIRTDVNGECYIDPEAKICKMVGYDSETEDEMDWQFCGSPRLDSPFSPLINDLRASPTWSDPSPKPLLYDGMSGKILALYSCKATKIQSVVRGGLVRMRRWRKKCEENDIILLNATIKIQALARRFLVRMRVWNVRSTNPEFASAMKSAVRGWLLGEPKKCVKHDLKPVRSGYDHTTYECRKCDYDSGCV